jgi:hypothetical protein
MKHAPWLFFAGSIVSEAMAQNAMDIALYTTAEVVMQQNQNGKAVKAKPLPDRNLAEHPRGS